VQELEYAENGTFKRYSGYETLNISPSVVFTAAEFNYAQAAVAVSISGLEELMNAGESQLIDLLESRIGNAERTLTNNIALDCYSDGTADGGKQIGGLQLLVAGSPANTVGGIDASQWAFWKNIAFDATTDGGSVASTANIQSYMNRVYLQLVRGADKPDLVIADGVYYRLYLESLQAIQRVTTAAVSYEPSTYQTALAPIGTNLPRPIAFAMSANGAASYGWYQIGGLAIAAKAVATSLAAAAAVGVKTVGLVAASGTSKEIQGALVAAVASAKSDVSTVKLMINRPHMQGRLT
jgi:hypothetical protein